jgi:hypothetical protein
MAGRRTAWTNDRCTNTSSARPPTPLPCIEIARKRVVLPKCANVQTGRVMAQAVIRRPSTAEVRVRSWVSPCGDCGGQSGTGTGFSPSCRFFPCQCHSTGAPLLVKLGKKNCSSSSQGCTKSLRPWCVRSICCGALHHVKKRPDT